MDFRRHQNREEVGFQLTPMADLFFVLIIFFMTMWIYKEYERNLEVVVPKASSGKNSDRAPAELIVNVTRGGRFIINGVDKNPASLDLAQPVIIRADAEAPHRFFVTVFDLCQKNGLENVRIATLPPEK
jgi:biopolymer transport protein ExbD